MACRHRWAFLRLVIQHPFVHVRERCRVCGVERTRDITQEV